MKFKFINDRLVEAADITYTAIDNPTGQCTGCAFNYDVYDNESCKGSCYAMLDLLHSKESGCSGGNRSDKKSVKWLVAYNTSSIKDVDDTRTEDEKNLCEALLG
jgi:hypothetical protein